MLTWIKEKYYHYNLWTGLYMLDPWEKTLFSTLAGRRRPVERLALWFCCCEGETQGAPASCTLHGEAS